MGHKAKQYMVEMSYFPGDAYDCANFFNESWICFGEFETTSDFFPVDFVFREPDEEVNIECQLPAPWHLSSLNHEKLPVPDGSGYAYNEGKETFVYVLDTWVDVDHPEFQGRATRGSSFSSGEHVHGTHVAGLIGGSVNGVNKKAKIVSVQVLDERGLGAWSTIVRGLEWISQQTGGGIINISISGRGSDIVDGVVKRMIRRGWKVVVAAGNDAQDACSASPARVKEAVTVGAIDSQGQKASFSNYGQCVDVYAPGQDIMSAYPQGGYALMSGTSMAAPILAGVWSLKTDWDSRAVVKNARLTGGLLRVYMGTPPVAC